MKMPVLFIGHGSPVNIIEDNTYTRSLADLGKTIPRPEAVVVVSAHWQTRRTYITCSEKPPVIYDFYGFPEELYQIRYNCAGSPETGTLAQKLAPGEVYCDPDRGLDHAAWAVLKHMYPAADIPVLELSLDVLKSPREHYDMGKKLAPLRERNVLIIGSGNIVHNLFQIDFSQLYGRPFPWAADFDRQIAELLTNGDHSALIHYEKLAHARLAAPTNEHYLPMLYAIALQEDNEHVHFTCTDMQNGSISMRSFMIGGN